MAKKRDYDFCAFCGRERKDAAVLVKGELVSICDSCVLQAAAIVQEEVNVGLNPKAKSKGFKFLICTSLDRMRLRRSCQ